MIVFQEGFTASAVIFDFDGVIVDTEPLHYAAFQRILEPLGLGFSWDQYIETYMGFDDRDAFLEAFRTEGQTLLPQELARLVDAKAIIFQEVIRDGIKAYPGVIELITDLRAAGLPLAICSGALLSDITPILKILNISNCFDTIVTAEEVAKSKPDPECYRTAFSRLLACHPDRDVTAGQTIAIEDTPAGIQSAKAAGLQVIAVTNSYPETSLSEADHIITSLKKLIYFKPV